MDITNTNNPQNPMTMATPNPNQQCGMNHDPAAPTVDPELMSLSDRFFVSLRKEAYRTLKTQEAEHLAMPWGPRIDVVFHPKGAPGVVSGRLRIMARTKGAGDIEIASANITSSDTPISLSASFGCDEYVVKASSGIDPGPGARLPESYFYARVYAGLR